MAAGSVAAAHPLAVAAGLEVLRSGGTAVDAAVAVSFAIGVVEPLYSGIGGGGVALLRIDGEVHALNFRETAPSGLAPGDARCLRPGPHAVGVPGHVAGVHELWRRFGTRPWAELLRPAARLARDGFPEPPVLKQLRTEWAAHIARTPESQAFFTAQPPGRWVNKALAATLDRIAEEGPDAFYRGDVAASICRAAAGLISPADLDSYRPRWVEPLDGAHAGVSLWTMPLPSVGGAGVLAGLRTLAGGGALAEAVRAGQAVRQSQFGSANTTHLSVIDGQGNAVALTQTINYYGGCFAPECGVLLNCELTDFDGSPESPNAPGPGKTPWSSMSPVVGLGPDGTLLAVGSPGARRIPSALINVLHWVLDRGLSLPEALAKPRLHWENGGLRDEAAEGGLSKFYGGVHAVMWRPGSGFSYAADPRRDGSAGEC